VTRPSPIIGMRRRQRATGEPYLHAVVGDDLHVPAGSTLDLRRIAPDDADGPTFALLIVPPCSPWKPSRSERARVDADRLDGTALRALAGEPCNDGHDNSDDGGDRECMPGNTEPGHPGTAPLPACSTTGAAMPRCTARDDRPATAPMERAQGATGPSRGVGLLPGAESRPGCSWRGASSGPGAVVMPVPPGPDQLPDGQAPRHASEPPTRRPARAGWRRGRTGRLPAIATKSTTP
jgi:hypothetical protein